MSHTACALWWYSDTSAPSRPDWEAEAYRLKGGGIKPGTWALKQEAEPDLRFARRQAGRADRPERRVPEGRSRIREVRSVEHVEHVKPDLERRSRAEDHPLGRREIGVEDRRPPDVADRVV